MGKRICNPSSDHYVNYYDNHHNSCAYNNNHRCANDHHNDINYNDHRCADHHNKHNDVNFNDYYDNNCSIGTCSCCGCRCLTLRFGYLIGQRFA